MPGTDPRRAPDSAAIQFMILDLLEEILEFSDNPGEMGHFLTRRLREVIGARTVLLLQHGPGPELGQAQIVAVEPERARCSSLLAGVEPLAFFREEVKDAAFFARASVPPGIAAAMDRLGLSSFSRTPLRVGGLRVGTLLALDHVETHRSEDMARLLSILSPVLALILRNTLHFQFQEARALAKAEDYEALLQTNLDGYLVVGRDARILAANDAYLRMSGYRAEEIEALRVTDLEASETPEVASRHIAQIMEQGSDRFTSRHRRKDGTMYPVEISATYVPSQGHAIGFIRDLTERLASETALRESEAHHRELVEILGEGIAATDTEETICMANREAERIFGLSQGRLVGKNLRAFLDDAEWQRVVEHTRRRQGGQRDTYQVRIRRADGEARTLQLTATPQRDARGQFTGSLAVLRDITDELRTQEALRLSQKMESLGNLAGGVAHDMNNILGAILGLATIHLDLEPEGSDRHAAFQTITKACLRGRNMVKRLLDFSRKDVAGERSVALNTLVREEARLLEPAIPANIEICLDLDPAAGMILGDPDALSLMLMNLCVNAIDAMPGGGSLSLRTRPPAQGRALLEVSDTGTGMPPEVLEHAFEPFYTTKPHGKGTGLGLSLVYNTVKAHHGELEVHSRPGQGTTFSMRFPSTGPEPNQAHAKAREAAAVPASLAVLLVDDDELIRSAISAQLEVMGHTTAQAASGEEAMDQVERGLRPSVVLLDMNMPGWGGARTLPMLRAALPDAPILLCTGRADQQAIDLAHAHPGVTILAKPFSFRELQAAFAAVLAEP